MTHPQRIDQKSPDPLEARVRAEHSRLLFENSWLSGATAPLVVGLMCWMLWPYVDHGWLVGWWLLKTLIAGARLAIWWRWRTDPDVVGRDRWSIWLLVAFAADGLTYGLVATVFFPADGTYRALMLGAVAAVAGAGQIVVAAHARGAAWFVWPLVVPVIVVQLGIGDRIGLFSAAGLAVFLAILAHESHKATATALSMIRMRFEFDDLAQQRAEALTAAQRNAVVKDRFMATMSHELRTPLHGLLGLARLAHDDSPAGSRAATHLDTLQRVGAHLLELIGDVLDYTRIDSGRVQSEPRMFDLLPLLEGMSTLSTVTAHEKGLQFELQHDLADAEWVTGDARRLRQILLNLTGNAIKFTDAGRVRLAVTRQGQLVTFDVSDTGPGIDPAHAESIFDAFHQVDGSDRRRHGGSGLGLTIARELAQTLGGTLELLPRQQSTLSGASFRLTLPLPRSAGLARAADAHDSQPARADVPPGTVLLVEDNEVNALIAQTMLHSAGWVVDLATSGAAAVERFVEGQHALVLMDCQMPGMDGYEATRRIRAHEAMVRRSPVPIVALTAHGADDARQRSLDAGMNDHLSKPFTKDELLGMVGRWHRRDV